MAKGINRLAASYLKLKPGLHGDGNCLYLQCTTGPHGNIRRSWLFRYQLPGRKSRDMGLGGCGYVSLATARALAVKYRQLVRQGIDPIEARNAEVAKNLAASAAPAMSFDEAAAVYIRAHRASWTNVQHAADWPATLKRYASPVIGKLSVADVTTAHIMKILDPIWTEKPVTGSRVRQRIEAVLGWAKVREQRSGDNPARWSDHLDNLLPAPTKVRTVKHMAALPYADMPAFMAELRQRGGTAALALEFLALTAVRVSDVTGARHADVDLAKRLWTIPALSKTHREHRVPLSDAAIAVVEKARQHTVAKSEFLFCNNSGHRFSKNATFALIARMGRKGTMTAHGFRATFRTWAQEQTNFPWELAEMSLGHTVGTQVERAYLRSDAFQKRVAIMQAWADFCSRPTAPATIVPIRRRVRS